jgi:hypothetical protein
MSDEQFWLVILSLLRKARRRYNETSPHLN